MKKITFLTAISILFVFVASAQVAISEGTGYYEFNDETDIWKNTTTGAGVGTVMCEGVFKFDPDATDGSFDDMESEELTDYMIVDGLSGKAISLKAHNWFKIWHGIPANGGGDYVNDFAIVIDLKVSDATGIYSLFEANPTPSANGYTSELEIDALTLGSPDSDIGLEYSANTLQVDTWHRVVYNAQLGEKIEVYVDGELWTSVEGDFLDSYPAPYGADTDPDDAAFKVCGNNETYPNNDPARDGDKVIDMIAIFDFTLTADDIAGFGAPVSNKMAKFEENTLNVYPNPTSNDLTINGEGNFEIVNAIGKVVMSGVANKTIDVSSLATGVYVVALTSGEVVQTQKICIK